MKRNSISTLYRDFCIVLLTLIVIGIIWLLFNPSFFSYKTYQMIVKNSVSGLTIHSLVEDNGVIIGSVKNIELNHNNPQLIEILLNINKTTPITQGTTGSIAVRQTTGVVFVQLTDNGKNLQPLAAKSNQRYPVIPAAIATTTNGNQNLIDQNANTALIKMSDSIVQMNELLQAFLDKDNIESLKELLYNLQQVTSTIAMNSVKLTNIMNNAEKASVQVPTFFAQVTPFLQSSRESMIVLQSQTMPMAFHTLAELNELLRELLNLVGSLKQNPAVLIRGTAPRLGPGENHSAGY